MSTQSATGGDPWSGEAGAKAATWTTGAAPRAAGSAERHAWAGPMRIGGGGGIGLIIGILLISWLLGINPLTLLNGDLGGGPSGESFQEARPQSPEEAEMTQFVKVVLAETEDTWNGVFEASGSQYPDPKLVLFSGQTPSACGYASAASGPFYCPNDQQVYIDLAFYEELRRRFQAPGDFAQAYVIAHEVGHHVQNLIGVLPEFNWPVARRGSRLSTCLSAA